ncbi:MAG TPA: hypothetical protein EYP78_06935 [Candidatus Omnitrophica bacterium]|nr:hypothetical protein [Candidatus Omnitrophota bacterium]
MSPKTVQIRESTYRLLERLKKRMGAKSFGQVIEKLALKELGIDDSMFGVDRGKLTPFKKEDRMEDREW